MKNLMSIICVLLFFISCKKDSIELLQQADSIMNNNCDSALTLLTQIDASEFHQNSTRAYYALLLTEARYKNFLPLQSDSLINIAVKYYSRKNNPQLYGRALMYEGCTLFEMLDYNGAMEAYKLAEVEFEKASNSTMLGLINTRLGEIYEKTYEDKDIVKQKYYAAAQHFKSNGDSIRVSDMYKSVGRQFIFLNKTDSAFIYFNKALDYLGGRVNVISLDCYYLMMEAFMQGKQYDAAIELGIKYRYLNDLKINTALAEAYIHIGDVHEAEEIFNSCNSQLSDFDKYLFAEKKFKKELNYEKALMYRELADDYADSLLQQRHKNNITFLEKKFDYTKKELEKQKAEYKVKKRFYIIVILLLLLISIAILAVSVYIRKKKEMQEYITSIELLVQEKNKLSDKSLHLEEESNIEKMELYALLERRFVTMQNLLDISYQYIDSPNTFVSKFKSELSQNNSSKNLLEDLCKMVDKKYNGNLSSIRRDYPNLKDSDMQIISLYCEDFTVASIAILFNTTMTGIHAKKYRITKKLNINGSLKSFVQGYHTRKA